MNNSDYQQELQLIHQLQSQTLSVGHTYLLILFALPLSIHLKLAIYHFFTTLPLPSLSPMQTTVLILVAPILFLLFLYFFFKFIITFIRLLIPFVLSKLQETKEEKKFLELTFPSDTSKSAYATKQLYTLFHTLVRQKTLIESLTQTKKQYSLEIVSTKSEGIRYLLIANSKNIDILKRNLLSYLPGIKIKEVDDYLDKDNRLSNNQTLGIAKLKLSSHFALPLNNQKTLSEHDPISYLTGNMTNLDPNELIAFQMVVTPVLSSTHGKIVNEMKMLRHRMYKGLPLTESLQKSPFHS